MGGCNSQADCPRHYCCAKKAFVEGEFNCVPNRKKNELCLNGGEDEVLYDGKFDITCPCDEGLQALISPFPMVKEKFLIFLGENTINKKRGFVSKGVPTCRKIEKTYIKETEKGLQRHFNLRRCRANFWTNPK
ncbi:hypothetical protein HNY73_004251 [Argiope bruennichi]|uniref:Uncharacterized protein n=1 Tax=Argiope bruennichi TaxID=94029 RepID=A0A8T0FNM7_ARGBR|nr:hypothetical protein HNY73_004251 [Argiope bruennichi]